MTPIIDYSAGMGHARLMARGPGYDLEHNGTDFVKCGVIINFHQLPPCNCLAEKGTEDDLCNDLGGHFFHQRCGKPYVYLSSNADLDKPAYKAVRAALVHCKGRKNAGKPIHWQCGSCGKLHSTNTKQGGFAKWDTQREKCAIKPDHVRATAALARPQTAALARPHVAPVSGPELPWVRGGEGYEGQTDADSKAISDCLDIYGELLDATSPYEQAEFRSLFVDPVGDLEVGGLEPLRKRAPLGDSPRSTCGVHLAKAETKLDAGATPPHPAMLTPATVCKDGVVAGVIALALQLPPHERQRLREALDEHALNTGGGAINTGGEHCGWADTGGKLEQQLAAAAASTDTGGRSIEADLPAVKAEAPMALGRGEGGGAVGQHGTKSAKRKLQTSSDSHPVEWAASPRAAVAEPLRAAAAPLKSAHQKRRVVVAAKRGTPSRRSGRHCG